MGVNYIVLQFSTTQWTVPNSRWRTLQVRWRNRYSWAIRKMCHSPFSHVDFVLDDGSLLGASDMGKGSPLVDGNPCGVAIRPPDYEVFGYRRRAIIQTGRADAILKWAHGQIGAPFDNSALWNFLSDDFPGTTRNWRDPSMWFCAEFSERAFEMGCYWGALEGVGRMLPWPKSRVTPTDLLLVFAGDPNFINADTFWEPVPGLKLHPGEV